MMKLKDMTHGEMNVMNGPDEMLLCGLSAGCAGGIGTTYNVMLPLYKKIYELYNKGDMKEALEFQKKADKVVGVLIKYGVIQATKAVLEMMGFEVGNATFPMKRYTDEEKAQVKEVFQKVADLNKILDKYDVETNFNWEEYWGTVSQYFVTVRYF